MSASAAGDKLLTPEYYASVEGEWLVPWTGPSRISAFLLEQRLTQAPKDAKCIYLDSIKVHALYFSDGSAWDVRNRWRKDFDWRERMAQGEYCPWCNWQMRSFARDNCENCRVGYGVQVLPWICMCSRPAWVWHQSSYTWQCSTCNVSVEILDDNLRRPQ